LPEAQQETRGSHAAREHGDAHNQECVRLRPRRRASGPGYSQGVTARESTGDLFRISDNWATIITFSA
jgi:hypothetical protein